jgi:prefoldin alpha subunit
MNDDEARTLYERFMQLQEQAQALEQHMQNMQEQLRNLEKTKETVTHLQTLTQPTQTWVPMAPGAYVKAQLQPADTILLNVGASIAVEKEPAAVIQTLDEHAKVLHELQEAALQELQEILAEIETIRNQVATE